MTGVDFVDIQKVEMTLEDGTVEVMRSGMIIVNSEDDLSIQSINLTPVDQILYSAIIFHQLMTEYVSEGEMFSEVTEPVRELIRLFFEIKKRKGDAV